MEPFEKLSKAQKQTINPQNCMLVVDASFHYITDLDNHINVIKEEKQLQATFLFYRVLKHMGFE